jgi:cytochrome c
VLLRVDEASYNPKPFAMGADHPLSWCKEVGNGGRMFYTSLGHTKKSYTEEEFVQHIRSGLSWLTTNE